MSFITLDAAPRVAIESFRIDDNDVVWYVISVSVGERRWTLSHRYSEFDALHKGKGAFCHNFLGTKLNCNETIKMTDIQMRIVYYISQFELLIVCAYESLSFRYFAI
jgi:hypothetical protein